MGLSLRRPHFFVVTQYLPLLFTRCFYSVEAPRMIYTVKDRKETFAVMTTENMKYFLLYGEVFYELSAATSRLERERVRTVYITREAA